MIFVNQAPRILVAHRAMRTAAPCVLVEITVQEFQNVTNQLITALLLTSGFLVRAGCHVAPSSLVKNVNFCMA